MSDPAEITENSVTLVRTFEASPEAVFAAWTVPATFARWFGTPPYETDPSTVEIDPRVGGMWQATMVSTEDGTEQPFAGRYLEVQPPDWLVLTFEDPAKLGGADYDTLTLAFRDLGDGRTELWMRQAGRLPPEQYPLLAEGYSRFFERMAKVLARG